MRSGGIRSTVSTVSFEAGLTVVVSKDRLCIDIYTQTVLTFPDRVVVYLTTVLYVYKEARR